jgi:HTH-type transcriptional regulator / antitoxin HigA
MMISICKETRMATETQPAETTPDLYLDLVRAFPLRPIRSDDEHDRAIATINAVADRRDTWGTDEEDYFLVLALLIERYESEIYPDPPETD